MRIAVVRQTRWKFWNNLFKIIWHKPSLLASYLNSCAFLEHVTEYRQIVYHKINSQLAAYQAAKGVESLAS